MPLIVTTRPLATWPQPHTKERKPSKFRSTYTQTLQLLEEETDALNARNIEMHLAIPLRMIRSDGWPRLDATPLHPGVILTFEDWVASGNKNDKGEALGTWQKFNFPCDTFEQWQDNLRAIALSLEALRKLDRFGVSKNGQQYKGWQPELPPAGQAASGQPIVPTISPFPSQVEALAFLVQHGDPMAAVAGLKDLDMLEKSYKVAARKLHPDTPGGSHELFVQLGQAMELLRKPL